MAVFRTNAALSTLERLRLDELEPAFRDRAFLDRFHAVCDARVLSFRDLDYLCVHYAAQRRVQYSFVQASGRQVQFDLHGSYQQWLRRWKKRMFDIFRRADPVQYEWNGAMHTTTVAQINFVYWMLIHRIDEYMNSHAQAIKEHKAAALARARKKRTPQRQRIAPAPVTPSLRVSTDPTVVALDPESS